MAGAHRLVIGTFLALFLVSACSAQALVEYAAGAAVGTAGSAGGKVVSKGIDRIFKKTDAAARKAADNPPPVARTEKGKAALKTSSVSGATPGVARPATNRLSRPRVEGAVVSLNESTTAPLPAELPPPVRTAPAAGASAEEFAKITPGTSHQELLKQVGTPSYRVRIQGDGHVQEIYRYSSNGVDLGSVRVVDGEVTAVRPRRK